ncbi:18797_t:CDS:2 [Funneliformis geosporum]|nr:18797_t:CDS:2 [Funneliformis geosporum]
MSKILDETPMSKEVREIENTNLGKTKNLDKTPFPKENMEIENINLERTKQIDKIANEIAEKAEKAREF